MCGGGRFSETTKIGNLRNRFPVYFINFLALFFLQKPTLTNFLQEDISKIFEEKFKLVPGPSAKLEAETEREFPATESSNLK